MNETTEMMLVGISGAVLLVVLIFIGCHFCPFTLGRPAASDREILLAEATQRA